MNGENLYDFVPVYVVHYLRPYHHSGGDGYTSTTVCVGHDVAETDTQERDGDEPHGVEEICMFLIVKPVVTKRQAHYFNDEARVKMNVISYLSRYLFLCLMFQVEYLDTLRYFKNFDRLKGLEVVDIIFRNR